MRQITENAYSAFNSRKRFKSSNTEVRIDNDVVYLLLHDNKIAKRTKDGELFLSHAGWPTKTTRERLSPFVNKIRNHQGDIIIEEKVKLNRNWTHYD
jgi:hypothetical protein